MGKQIDIKRLFLEAKKRYRNQKKEMQEELANNERSYRQARKTEFTDTKIFQKLQNEDPDTKILHFLKKHDKNRYQKILK